MNPGAAIVERFRRSPGHHHDTAWASVVAGLFVLLAALSFAIDQSLTVSDLPAGYIAPLVGKGASR